LWWQAIGLVSTEIAKVVVAYREKDAHLWKDDLEKVISTFEWNNPH
jgi:hypothetical protein